MRALDLVSFTATAPSTGAAMTVLAGDSANIRNATLGSKSRIIAAWTKAQAVGNTQIIHPSGSDTTHDIWYRNVANAPINMFPRGVAEDVEPQELLSLTQVGSATAGDVELAHVVVAYDDLPGINSRMITREELDGRRVRLLTLQDTITPTVASTYSGARSFSQSSSLLRANTDYAILGVSIGITCGAITLRGVDTGNLRCGVPGQALANSIGVNWFVELSEWFGEAFIPVVNSANAGGIFTEIVQDENLTAVPFSWMMMELANS